MDPSPALLDRFARFFDDDYRAYTVDIPAVLDVAEQCGDPVLELGCGTGRLLLPLAQAGHTVTGIDLSPAQLARARAKLAAAQAIQRVTLVETDMRSFELPRRDFALAVCMTNTLLHLVSPEAQLACLERVYAHLRPGGRLLLDVFNPDVPRLLAVNGLQELVTQWEDAATGNQVFKWCVRTVDLAAQIQEVLFIYEEVLPDGHVRRTPCPFTLRFLWRNELELMLRVAGFSMEAVWGDFDGIPYDNNSEYLIVLAHKPG